MIESLLTTYEANRIDVILSLLLTIFIGLYHKIIKLFYFYFKTNIREDIKDLIKEDP
jgi:hypothetical protein